MFCNKNSAKFCNKFFCEKCQYGTDRKSSYDDHLLSSRHINVTNCNINSANSAKFCNILLCPKCSKEFNNRTSLWRHKKTCIEQHIIQPDPNGEFITKEIFMMVVNQNKELLDLLKVGTNNNNNTQTHTNSHNKTFNLQFFLNETCKNAMNIDEFVSSIKPTFEDLEHVGKVGYAEGISNIIIKRLNEVGVTERPFHCSDVKRNILYVRNNNDWIKETDEKPLLVTAIKQIAKLNMDNILPWQLANPGCTDSDSMKNKKYLNMVLNSMDGSSDAEAIKNVNKIISRVSNTVQLTDYKGI